MISPVRRGCGRHLPVHHGGGAAGARGARRVAGGGAGRGLPMGPRAAS